MTGPRDSVIGVKKELVLRKFLTSLPVRFETASGTLQLCAVLTNLGEKGKAKDIERINLTIEP
ncbi:TIGR00282 family metallophosphoesterase [Heliorestis convoluta]|uniref:TIGR00282 family metallophosphoesterase n=1 Tax=Heliorestis convoluta TaxID=356322 RepID=A0A5Q2N3R3_9FIRM|nr:TIGR00282 family metallophosphoesterase [Heliorestis convoluta]